MEKKHSQEKVIQGLEFTGAVAALILIAAVVLAFIVLDFTPHFMALAVGCGIVVNAVLMVLAFVKNHIMRGVATGVITVFLIVVFVFQILILEG